MMTSFTACQLYVNMLLKFENLMKLYFWFVSSIVALLLCAFSAFPAKAQTDQEIPTDNVSSTEWWQRSIRRQMTVAKNKHYDGCLFGDSISSGVGNTLGKNNFNFAIGGMSTVSLIEQLQKLLSIHVKCQKAIVAIGTNDAMYDIRDDMFINNLEKSITLLRSMGIQEIVLIPAFYSTISANYNPHLAGTLTRVDEINDLIRQVAVHENVAVEGEGIQPLYQNQALKENLTTDGVHLNQNGIRIYRQALFKILASTTAKQPSLRQVQPTPSTASKLEDTVDKEGDWSLDFLGSPIPNFTQVR